MMSFNGVLVMDKPQGLVSMRLVEKVRRMTGTKKAGHVGTLDPLATGVLPICLGKATRIASLLLDEEKEYLATVRLGLETDTYDTEGQLTESHDIPKNLAQEDIEQHLPNFTGRISQKPPIYSAIRHKGKRLYERARNGETVEVAPREVLIHAIEVVSWSSPHLRLKIHCGKGTYIRSIASDLGKKIGCGGCLSELRRTRVGNFKVDSALTIEELTSLTQKNLLESKLIDLSDALQHLPRYTVTSKGKDKVGFGQPLSEKDIEEIMGKENKDSVCLLDSNGKLIALGEQHSETLYPRKVLI